MIAGQEGILCAVAASGLTNNLVFDCRNCLGLDCYYHFLKTLFIYELEKSEFQGGKKDERDLLSPVPSPR